MTRLVSISLSDSTYSWLKQEAAQTGDTPAEFISKMLSKLADPDNAEAMSLDQLLAEAVSWFPPLMTLEEQEEMREEVLDFLCRRIEQQYASQVGQPMSKRDQNELRDRL